MNIPCCVKSLCDDPANPFANFSAEKPDPDLFVGYNSGGWYGPPPVGTTFSSLGCISFCQSSVSQADADRCAAAQEILCTVTPCNDPSCAGGGSGGGGGGGNDGWLLPSGFPTPVYANTQQECTVNCPDGIPFNFVVPAGQYFNTSQTAADDIAQSFACNEAALELMCLSNLPNTCSGQFYDQFINVTGGDPPIVYDLIAGAVPPGMTFQQAGAFSATVFGTCNVPGNYEFTVRATDSQGVFMVKTYNLGVIGITNTPPQGTIGSVYSFTFSVTGGTSPFTFALAGGALPAGLSLTVNGAIIGTPTTAQSTNFTVAVTDTSGVTCNKDFSMTVVSNCNATTDWFSNPGNCRLRIKNYNPLTFAGACPACSASVAPDWAGQFSQFCNAAASEKYSPPSGVSIGGKAMAPNPCVTSNLGVLAGFWVFQVSCDNGGGGLVVWSGQGPAQAAGPLGTYAFGAGCLGGPATLEIEAYSL